MDQLSTEIVSFAQTYQGPRHERFWVMRRGPSESAKHAIASLGPDEEFCEHYEHHYFPEVEAVSDS